MAIATAAPSEIFFFIASILQENIFDPQLEQVGHAEGEGERRVVFPRLDRVHRPARHFEPLGENALAPVALCAPELEAVRHTPRLPFRNCATPSQIAQTPKPPKLPTLRHTLPISTPHRTRPPKHRK